jgi:thymidylate synthase
MKIFAEKQYLSLISKILKEGVKEEGRNGTVIKLIGAQMRFPLNNNSIPLITTKKLAWRVCLKELLWFISGSTDNGKLKEQGVKIWNKNASREFLDNNGFSDRVEDDLGPVYGHQWRHFNAPYLDCDFSYRGEGVDQLKYIEDMLKNKETRKSRRILMSAWNPCQIPQMALPPCHVLSQFHVTEGNKLSCSVYQRSADIGLGLPFNIASYSFLTHLLAKHCDLEACELIHTIGDAHIYEEHTPALETQIGRNPLPPPYVNIKNKREKLEDYKFKDFVIEDYNYYDEIKMDMKA